MSILCHDIEATSKNQVAHDVVVQIRRPLRHVERLRPFLVTFIGLEYNVSESLHILHQ